MSAEAALSEPRLGSTASSYISRGVTPAASSDATNAPPEIPT
jgi:hypothetical protein